MNVVRPQTPTQQLYTGFEDAYAWFNADLFGNELPACLITVARHRKAYGYFWHEGWRGCDAGVKADEIALNPEHFESRSAQQVLSTLVHEMCHLWQAHFGEKLPRNGYHNREWGLKMQQVGLIPSSTGQPGGKSTGVNMSHYIQEGGAFDQSCSAFLSEGFVIPWRAATLSEAEKARKKTQRASKTKFTCGGCGQNAWAKPEAKLLCGECEAEMEAA